MDSILLNNLFIAVNREQKLFAQAQEISKQAQTDGLGEILQEWGAAYQDVKDKEAALEIG